MTAARDMFADEHVEACCERCGEVFAVSELRPYGVGRDLFCGDCLGCEEREAEEAEEQECACRGGCSRCTGTRGTCF